VGAANKTKTPRLAGLEANQAQGTSSLLDGLAVAESLARFAAWRAHGNFKEQIRSSAPESVEEMRRQVDRGFNRLRKHPDLLLSFFCHAGLGV
jgi:hypothetical protein